jgi:hypothetical protein
MKIIFIYLVVAATLAAAPKNSGDTKLEPFTVWPRTSVYALLTSPEALRGKTVRTSGFVVWRRETLRLYASSADARDGLPDNFIGLLASEALKKDAILGVIQGAKEAIPVEVVGRFEERVNSVFPLVIAEVSELRRLGEEEPNQSPEPTPAAGTSAAEQPLVPAAVVAHL